MPALLTPEIISLIAQLAIKYVPDVAIAFANLFKPGKTIDDAIAALELAKTKTAEQYLADAKAAYAAQLAAAAAAGGTTTTTTVVTAPTVPAP